MTTQTQRLTWDDVLKRTDLIGGDLQSIEDGVAYRGPLAKIELNDDRVVFTQVWCARKSPHTGGWKKWAFTFGFVLKDKTGPIDIGEGRVRFSAPHVGEGIIFPKGHHDNLSGAEVVGLPPASERLLALYPELPFDRDVARQVLVEGSWPHQAEALYGLQEDATLRDLSAMFLHDSQAEEFLWHYVEAVTGEKGVCEKVY